MLKFWKKKPAGTDRTAEDEDAATEADTAAPAEALSPLPAAPGQREEHAAGTDTPGRPAGPQPSALSPQPEPPPVSEAVNRAGSPTQETTAASPLGPPPKRTWRERLAGSIFNRDIRTLFARNPKLDDALLDELETVLIGADVGVAASTALVEDLRRRMGKREFTDSGALLAALRADLVALLEPVAQPLRIASTEKPFVLLTVGVNGVGKTTTIGKLARRFQAQGHSVVLAAGDTFRAAAVEQLRTWGERNNVPVVAQGTGADAASVIFDAMQSARSRRTDVLIADTAGRLHTQSGLMDELAKIRRVLGKLDPDAPHEVLLVIDGTTGQNAINQTRQFRAAIGVTGLVVTKLDGTAKGGVMFALAKEFGLPIRFVGLGESAEDLREFDPAEFVDALLPANIGGAPA